MTETETKPIYYRDIAPILSLLETEANLITQSYIKVALDIVKNIQLGLSPIVLSNLSHHLDYVTQLALPLLQIREPFDFLVNEYLEKPAEQYNSKSRQYESMDIDVVIAKITEPFINQLENFYTTIHNGIFAIMAIQLSDQESNLFKILFSIQTQTNPLLSGGRSFLIIQTFQEQLNNDNKK